MGDIIAATGDNHSIIIWDILHSSDCITKLYGHTAPVNALCFSPCCTLLASGSDDCSIVLWECGSWTQRQVLLGHTEGVLSVRFDKEGVRLVSVSIDGSTRIWNVESGSLTLTVLQQLVSCAAFDKNGDEITLRCGNSVFAINAITGNYSRSISVGCYLQGLEYRSIFGKNIIRMGETNCLTVIMNDRGVYFFRVLTNNGRYEVVGRYNVGLTKKVTFSYPNNASIWSVVTAECLLTLRGHTDVVCDYCFSQDGSKVITASFDGTVKVWDSNTGEELRTFVSHEGPVLAVATAFCSTGTYI